LKKKTSLDEIAKGSLILILIHNVSAYISNAFRKSFFGGLIISDGKEEALYERGMTRSILNCQTKRNSPLKKISHFASYEFEKSLVFGLLQKLCKAFFALKMRSVGLFMLAYSVFAAIASIIKYYPFDRSGWFLQLAVLLALMIVSLTFILSKSSVIETLYDSKLFSGVLSEGLGIDFDHKMRETKNIKLNIKTLGAAPVLGILCGLSAVFVQPIDFVVAVLMIFTCVFIFSKPETGVIIIIFAMPFGDLLLNYGIDILRVLIIITLVAYLCKLLFGRRDLVVEFLDVFVLLVLIITAACCFGNPGAGDYNSIRRVALFIVTYILFVNLIKTRGWFLRAVNAFVFSLCTSVFLGVAIPLLSYIPYVKDVMPAADIFSNIYLFSSPSEAIYLLIPALPFLFSAVTGSKPGRKGSYMLYAIIACVCVMLGGNPVAFPAIIASLIVYVLCTNPSLVFAGIPIGMVYIAVSGLKIPVISDLIASSHSFASNALADNMNVARGSWRAIMDYWTTGIGFGSESFSKIYPNYAYAGFENADNAGTAALILLLGFGVFGTLIVATAVFLFMRETFGRIIRTDNKKDRAFLSASAASIVGYAVAIFFDNIFAVDTVCLYIFTIMAISASYMRIVKNEERRKLIQHPDTPDHVDRIIFAKHPKKNKASVQK